MSEYMLSASLAGHEDDVRCVAYPHPSSVISCSRDATVRHWTLKADSSAPAYEETIAYHGQAFINTCSFIPPSSAFPNGLIVSGGKDTIIDVRPPGRPPEADAQRLLLGHQGNVCSLDVDPDFAKTGTIVSGSWDASALIWNVEKGEAVATLGDHTASVWAAIVYDSKIVITACADGQIRTFTRDGKTIRTFKGGDQPVRALCRLPAGQAAQFASAGNDGIIRLWTIEGQEVAQLHGHENFVYSLACLPNGDIVSSSEDRTVRIWRNTECIQTITHPAISVWSVAACKENGDIVTGASDNKVRIFSRDPARHADEASIKDFNDAVQGSAIPKQTVEGVDTANLPGPDFLQKKSGTKEGQIQMIKEANGAVSVHQWSNASKEWIAVGNMVDSQGSTGRKQEYLGQDYDYVFDVDIAEGQPPLKLPYNLSQNPHEVAQKFIIDNELPIGYLDQVVNFILTNTSGASIGQQQGTSADPWGSENRYRPGEVSTPAPQRERPKVLPQKDYLYITTAAYPPMIKKINELNNTLQSDPSTAKLAFSSSDLTILPQLAKDLEAALSSSPPKPTTSNTLIQAVQLATHIITLWPPTSRIPGHDLFRLLAAATPSILTPSSGQRDFLSTIRASSALPTYTDNPTNSNTTSTANANTTMLTLRALVNLFAHEQGREMMAARFEEVWETFSPLLSPAFTSSQIPQAISTNRNVHTALTTLLINYAVLLALATKHTAGALDTPMSGTSSSAAYDIKEMSSRASRMFEGLLQLLADESVKDGEVIYRGLVALGTLMSERKLGVLGGGAGGGKKAEVTGRVQGVLEKVEKGAKEPRIKAVVGEIRGML